MATKLIDLNNKLRQLQAKKLSIQKDLITLNNEISSKKEYFTVNEKKYKDMQQELDTKKADVKKAETMGSRDADMADAYSSWLETYLETSNLKKEFAQIIREENTKIDRKYVVDLKEGNLDLEPENELYYKSLKEYVMVKFIKVKSKDAENEDEVVSTNFVKTFRINKQTSFNDLKEMVASFWNVNAEHYILTNEDGLELPRDEKIEKYFVDVQEEMRNMMLCLKPREYLKKFIPKLSKAIKIETQAVSSKSEEINFGRIKKDEINPYEEFFKEFPGQADFIDQEKVQGKKKKNEKGGKCEKNPMIKKTRIIDSDHCCVALWVLVLLIINVASLHYNQRPFERYVLKGSYESLLNVNNFLFSFNEPYQYIDNINGFYNYLDNAVIGSLFESSQRSFGYELLFREQNIFIGPMRLRQVRTKIRNDCVQISDNLNQTNVKCYYAEYNEDTRETTPIGSGKESWQIFKTASETGITTTVGIFTNGILGSYDGSGYVMDFDSSLTQEEARQLLHRLNDTNFIDTSTRAVILTLLINNIATLEFVRIQLGLEISVSGFVQTMDIELSSFLPSKYADLKYGATEDVFKTIFVALILFRVLYQLFTNEEGAFSNNIKYLFTFTAATDLSIIACVLSSVALNVYIDNLGYSTTQILNNRDKFIDLAEIAKLYNVSVKFDAYLIFFTTIRLLYFLRLFNPFYLVCRTIEWASSVIFRYVISFITIFFALAIIGMIFWGAFSPDWSTIVNAFFAANTLIVSHFDESVMAESQIELIALYITFYYFFATFCVIALYTGLTIDIYRRVTMESGEKYNARINGFMDMIEWMFSWLPWTYIKSKIDQRKRARNEKNKKLQTQMTAVLGTGRRVSKEITYDPQEKYKLAN